MNTGLTGLSQSKRFRVSEDDRLTGGGKNAVAIMTW